jgi:hypothetical protein
MNRDLCDTILRYLQHRMPSYPFDITVDLDFVDELLEDFPNSNVLEDIKAFRWFYDNAPAARVKNLRLAIRRWVANGSRYPS